MLVVFFVDFTLKKIFLPSFGSYCILRRTYVSIVADALNFFYWWWWNWFLTVGHPYYFAWGTLTVESSIDGAITLSRLNFSGYIGYVIIFSWMLNAAHCLLTGLRLIFDLVSWLVSGYAHHIYTTFHCHYAVPYYCTWLSEAYMLLYGYSVLCV